ncbi:DDE-type integrase/transposase/recombinase [Brevibacillus massiliensis]|uniref:DDE-type integrase/transposase/recombinase n=1 Tax=Brevibacillus massiliensis TaxID=1118054 RepID=UPI001FDEE255|nr:DDE-type integrase/transposase/recombinase [Brevibacillus massiliensis]
MKIKPNKRNFPTACPLGDIIQTNILPIMGKIQVQIMGNFHLQLTLMRKYKLVTKIRRANPYRKMARATHEHQTCPNLLERQFDQGEPEKVYALRERSVCLPVSSKRWGNKTDFGSLLSSSLELSLVEKTLERLLEPLDGNIPPEAILHSDQGTHYTHPKIRQMVSKAGFKQSMSRKGNCWDNASMETSSVI